MAPVVFEPTHFWSGQKNQHVTKRCSWLFKGNLLNGLLKHLTALRLLVSQRSRKASHSKKHQPWTAYTTILGRSEKKINHWYTNKWTRNRLGKKNSSKHSEEKPKTNRKFNNNFHDARVKRSQATIKKTWRPHLKIQTSH